MTFPPTVSVLPVAIEIVLALALLVWTFKEPKFALPLTFRLPTAVAPEVRPMFNAPVVL